MLFVTLIKFKKDPGAVAAFGEKMLKNLPKDIKVKETVWTLGQYDAVWIIEAPNERELFSYFLRSDGLQYAKTETLVGMPREEIIKMLEL
jgi:uncharacterized protein with GYD domain